MTNFISIKNRAAFFSIVLMFAASLLASPDTDGRLQKLIDTAASGDTIHIEDGVYKESLVINKDLQLIAGSAGGVILMPEVAASGYAVEIQPELNVRIEGLQFQLAGPDNTASLSGIKADGSSLTLLNCKIMGAQKIGVRLNNCTAVIENCRIENCGESGVRAEFGNITVKTSAFLKNKKHGVYLAAGEALVEPPCLEYEVLNSTFQGHKSAITIEGDCSGVISQNRFMDNDESSIFITDATGKNDIIENMIVQSHYGIYVNTIENEKNQTNVIKRNSCSGLGTGIIVGGEPTAFEITENKCLKSDDHGIYVESTGPVQILNNQCNENGAQGIYLGRVTSAIVQNNVCRNNKKNGIYSEASKFTSKNNILSHNVYHGISIDCGVVEIEDNQCVSNQGSGIYLSKYIDGHIKNNKLDDNRFYAIVKGDPKVLPAFADNSMTGNLKGTVWQEETEYADSPSLLIQKKYDELDAIARDYRKNETKNANSAWVISKFYRDMGKGWSNISAEHPARILEILEDWRKHNPDSIVPYIATAEFYVSLAWSFRGSGWGYTVEDENWPKFRDNLNKAVDVIRKAESLKEKDAFLYAVLITAGTGLNDNDLVEEGFTKGIAINKYYPPLYNQKALALLPRWGGKKGEVEAFADEADRLTADKPGAGIYARIVLVVHGRTYPDFDKFEFSYDTIKRSHEGILQEFPNSKNFLNSYCMFACLNNDREKAEELFRKINGNYDYAVWLNQSNVRKQYDWVFSKNVP
jgi:parallel beta-helix repeat protein